MGILKFPSPPAPTETVLLVRDGAAIMALVGRDLQEGIGGFGDTIPEALRNLADAMEREGWKSEKVT